jgi:hypothetical protein
MWTHSSSSNLNVGRPGARSSARVAGRPTDGPARPRLVGDGSVVRVERLQRLSVGAREDVQEPVGRQRLTNDAVSPR